MSPDLPLISRILGRLVVATLLGLVLGWERESRGKPAGLRTHMMVALGAASFTLVTLAIYQEVAGGGGAVRADPLRIVEGVIGGIGFLGAGTIIRSRGSVAGITTAATIWVAGAIGVAAGSGEYTIALSTTLMAWLILEVLWRLDRWISRRSG